MPLQLQGLSRKQKRLKAWTQMLSEEVRDPSLRDTFSEKLKLFRNLLAKCWESEEMSDDDRSTIEDLERQLDQLAEESRLSARP